MKSSLIHQYVNLVFQVHNWTLFDTKLLQLKLVHNNSITCTQPIDTQKIDFWNG